MHLRLSLTLILISMPFRAWTQCFTIHGKVTNAIDHQAIATSFFVKTEEGKMLVGKTTRSGLFSMEIPCNTTSLSIESLGFRPLLLPVSGNKGTYYFELILYPVDKQTNDRPYFQSEQKDMVLNNADSLKSKNKLQRVFKLIDVQSKAVLTGEICLFYTKTGDKKCFTTNSEVKSGDIIFDQEDIIGVVAKAAGYQPYNGNLIISRIDNSRSEYEIALSKAVSIAAISVESKKLAKIEVIDKKGNLIPLRMKDTTHGFASLNTSDDYQVRFYTGNEFKEISLSKVNGLMLVNGTGQIPQTPPAIGLRPASTSTVQLPAFNPLPSRVIYFHQSTYDLQPNARQTLDSIGAWLSQHPESTAQVIGFTDNVGDVKRNITLSEFRARVTTRYLINHGAKESQLQWKGMGGNAPAEADDKEENIALHRRVEIKFKTEVPAQPKKE